MSVVGDCLASRPTGVTKAIKISRILTSQIIMTDCIPRNFNCEYRSSNFFSSLPFYSFATLKINSSASPVRNLELIRAFTVICTAVVQIISMVFVVRKF